MHERSTILSGRLALPNEIAWFNELSAEERNEFLIGLLNLIALEDGHREQALRAYLRSWQAKSRLAAKSFGFLERTFLHEVEQELDLLLARKKPSQDLVAAIRKVRAQVADIWSDPVNEAFFEQFAR